MSFKLPFTVFFILFRMTAVAAMDSSSANIDATAHLILGLELLQDINITVLNIVKKVDFDDFDTHSALFAKGKAKAVWIKLFKELESKVGQNLHALRKMRTTDSGQIAIRVLRLNIFAILCLLDSLGYILPKALQFEWCEIEKFSDEKNLLEYNAHLNVKKFDDENDGDYLDKIFTEIICRKFNDKLLNSENIEIAMNFIKSSLPTFDYLFVIQKDNFDDQIGLEYESGLYKNADGQVSAVGFIGLIINFINAVWGS